MRIGIVCPYSFDEPGGVQAHIFDHARYLQQQGHFVQVIGPCSARTEVPDFVVKGGPSIGIPYNGSVARLAVGPEVRRKVRRFITEGDFDIFHIHEPNAPSFSLHALALAQGPIVATYHASATDSWLLRLAAASLRPLLEKIRGGIAVSEMARRWQVEQLGGDPVLIPNGVEVAQYATDRPHTPRELVFLGRLDEPRKGLALLLEALGMLETKLHVTVIGGGTPIPAPGVTYVGKVSEEDKIAYLQQADIYVAPNTGGESFGIVLVEAMAAGAVVVASDLEAFSSVLHSDSATPCGYTFRSGSAVDLARVLDRVVGEQQRRDEVRERGRARAWDFDWSRIGAEIQRVYDTVADGTKVRVR